MDIDLLSKMVKELILDNDEVTLPGVGTFVTEIIPSSFSDKGYTINPPYRRLYFRQKQNDQDSKLSDFYAQSNSIDKETAKIIISDFLHEMKETLLRKRIIVFPGLGRLRATKENNLFFIADEDLDIYPEGFGLESISLKTHQETTEEVSQAIEDLKSLITDQPKEESVPEQTAETAPSPEETTAPEQEAPQPPVLPREMPMSPETPRPEVPEPEILQEETAPETPQETIPVEEKIEPETPAVEIAEPVEEPAEPAEEIAEEAPAITEAAIQQKEEPTENAAQTSTEPAPQETSTPEPTEELTPTEKPEPVQAEEAPSLLREMPMSPDKAASTSDKKKKGLRTAVWIIIVLLILGILSLTAFIIVGHVAPELLDNLLYTPEELQIIHHSF